MQEIKATITDTHHVLILSLFKGGAYEIPPLTYYLFDSIPIKKFDNYLYNISARIMCVNDIPPTADKLTLGNLTLYKCCQNPVYDAVVYSTDYKISVYVRILEKLNRIFNKTYGRVLRWLSKTETFRRMNIFGYITYWHWKNYTVSKTLFKIVTGKIKFWKSS